MQKGKYHLYTIQQYELTDERIWYHLLFPYRWYHIPCGYYALDHSGSIHYLIRVIRCPCEVLSSPVICSDQEHSSLVVKHKGLLPAEERDTLNLLI